ncbi:hypothetical protein MTR67_013209, partial [Solanum verrucosum]
CIFVSRHFSHSQYSLSLSCSSKYITSLHLSILLLRTLNKMLDLSVLQSNFTRISRKPYVYVDSPSQKKLTRLLNICLNLSHG